MKTTTLACILTFFACFQTALGNEEINLETYKKCLHPSVLISSSTHKGTGSGTIIRSVPRKNIYANLILSCSHIFPAKNYNPVSITKGIYKNNEDVMINYENYQGIVLYRNDKSDISIIGFISEKEMPACSVDWAIKEKIGMSLIVSGCGMSQPPRIHRGLISFLREPSDMVWIDSFVMPGSSGGGVFHKNKLMGIIKSIDSYDKTLLPTSGQYSKIKLFQDDVKENDELKFITDESLDIPILPSLMNNISEIQLLKIDP